MHINSFSNSYTVAKLHLGKEFSSSDDEDEIEESTDSLPILQQTAQTKSLIEWFVIFLSVWQTVFSIPANAMNLLLKFIHIFLTVIANHYAKNSIKVITESLPRSLFTLQKHLNIEQDNIIKYTVCPSCYSLYKIEDCFQEDDSGEKIPKRCNFISFPNHSQNQTGGYHVSPPC